MVKRTLYISGDECLDSFYNNKGVLSYSNVVTSTLLKRVNTGDVIKYIGSIQNTAYYMSIFDNDLNFVKSINRSEGYTYTVLSGECYVGFNIDVGALHTTSVECECENVDYLSSPYYVGEIIFAHKDGDNVIDNAYINGNNGNQISLNGTSCSDYLNVSTLNKIQIASCYGNINNGVFYNVNKEFISNLGSSNALITLDIPTNAEYLRVSCNNTTKSTYVIGYALAQQSGEDPELPDSPVNPSYYSITYNLSFCVSSNNISQVEENKAYSTTITPVNGYKIDTVSVIMNDVDISSTCYNNGVISINEITGNIVINVVATEILDEPDTPIIPPTTIDSIPNLNSGLYVDCSKISYNGKSLKLIIDLLIGGVN